MNRELSSGCILHNARIFHWYINEDEGKLKLPRSLTHLEEVIKIQPMFPEGNRSYIRNTNLNDSTSKTTLNPDIDVVVLVDSNLLSVEISKYVLKHRFMLSLSVSKE